MEETVTLKLGTYHKIKQDAERFKKAKHVVCYAHPTYPEGEWWVYTDSELVAKVEEDLHKALERIKDQEKTLSSLNYKFDMLRKEIVHMLKGSRSERKKAIESLRWNEQYGFAGGVIEREITETEIWEKEKNK